MKTVISYEAMGTVWKVLFAEDMDNEKRQEVSELVEAELIRFENLYSRFKEDSLLVRISKQAGTYTVPHDFVAILRIYQELYLPSGKKFTPCIGSLLEDVGYDREYSFVQKEKVRQVPDFETAVTIIDDTHITLHTPLLLDIGAVGKGYCVDLVSALLRAKGYTDFLVDGSGDIYYESKDGVISVGLEHPQDTSLVIGSLSMSSGAMCSSATNRRVWGKYSHYLDPSTHVSPEDVIAVWVMTKKAAYADALSSALFFAPPSNFAHLSFEYCCMNNESRIKKSPGFLATFY